MLRLLVNCDCQIAIELSKRISALRAAVGSSGSDRHPKMGTSVALPTRCGSHRFQFPSRFQLRPSLRKLSAANSIAFRVLFKASQASDVGSIPIARSRIPGNKSLTDLFLTSVGTPVAIPGEVARECCGSKKALDAVLIQKALDESRIKTMVVKNRRLVGKLQADFSLGKGEAEAVALAVNEKAQLLGIDDKNGINACKLLGLGFTTAVGTLIRTREKGLLEGPEALERLARLARYRRYKDSIIGDARLKLEAKS